MNDAELFHALERLKVETGSLACLGCGHEHSCSVHGCAILRAARERIVNAPAADVAPVVHGRWVSDEADVLFRCSECWTQISTSWDYDDLRWNYCPDCGAKMDGEAT